MPHFLATRKREPDVRTNANRNTDPLHHLRTLAQKANRNHDCKQRRKRTNRRRDAERHVRNRAVREKPAPADNHRLDHQKQVVMQSQRLAMPGQKYRQHQKRVKNAAEQKYRTDSVILNRFLLSQVVKAKKNRRSKSQY